MRCAVSSIQDRIESLDVSLFDTIPTQSEYGDRQAWLAIQRSIRRQREYVYLEIGSHLGGSIQQHLVDPRCRKIVSVDKRPLSQPDDRGQDYHYEGNSTRRMLDNLRRVSPAGLDKIIAIDADARDIDPVALPPADFCFIDGEHTYSAVMSDFAFCLRACTPNATICFHDDNVIFRALIAIMSDLRRHGVPFTACKLPGTTFGIFLRDSPATSDPYISAHTRVPARWLRRQRFRSWVPQPLLPGARWLANGFRRRTSADGTGRGA